MSPLLLIAGGALAAAVGAIAVRLAWEFAGPQPYAYTEAAQLDRLETLIAREYGTDEAAVQRALVDALDEWYDGHILPDTGQALADLAALDELAGLRDDFLNGWQA